MVSKRIRRLLSQKWKILTEKLSLNLFLLITRFNHKQINFKILAIKNYLKSKPIIF